MANILPTTMEYFDKLLGEQLLDGEGGGGGSSDLSMATLTITNTYNNTVNIKGAFAYDENEMGEGSPTVSSFESATPGNTTQSLKLVLYKGSALINTGVVAKSTSGSIQELGGGAAFVVTGDCSVTV